MRQYNTIFMREGMLFARAPVKSDDDAARHGDGKDDSEGVLAGA